jgi:hypothetical protein
MIQSTLRLLNDSFASLIALIVPIMVIVLIILGVLLVASLVLYALDRDALNRTRDWSWLRLRSSLVWLPVVLGLFAVALGLSIARQAVGLRFSNQQNAQYSSREDPSGGQTIQYSPSVSYEKLVTYTRTFALPPDIAKQLGNDPAQALAPYINNDPNSQFVRKVNDSFVRKAGALLYTRTLEVVQRSPVALENAEVGVNFDFGDTGSGRSYYRANFAGKYSFSNPLEKATTLRFTFPLPDGSGTLSDFEMKVNGQVVTQSDLSQGYVWEGEVAAKQKIEIAVKYRNQGAQTWNYDFGSRREPIRSFKLNVITPKAVKFLRGSLYPTNQNGTLEWKLANVITSQSVVLSFPEGSLRETLTKVFSFAPLALFVMLGWVLAFAWRRNWRLEPSRVLLAILGFGFGFAVNAMLLGYASPLVAGLVGAIVAIGLAVLALGLEYALPVALSALLPLCFLNVGNAGLLISLIGLIALISLLPPGWFEQITKPRAPHDPGAIN